MTLAFMLVILGLGELAKIAGRLLANVDSLAALLIGMGGVGLLTMAGAVVVGVWVSVRIGIGRENAERYPSFAWWVINRLAFLVGATNLSSFAIYFVQGRLGLAGEAAAGPASQMMMVVGILILLCVLPSGWLSDRFGSRKMVAISGIAAALGTVILLLSPNMAVMYVGGAIIGAATGVFFTTNWALGTNVVPRQEAGRYLGISNLAGAGAGAVGAYIGGPIADYFTARVPEFPGLGYMLLFGIYAAMFLISTLVLSRVREAT
jgi:MFS family permease